MLNTVQNVRLVRLVTHVSHCNCLRLVGALGACLVRLVIAQVFDFIALGNTRFAAPRSLNTTCIIRPRLLARRACYGEVVS